MRPRSRKRGNRRPPLSLGIPKHRLRLLALAGSWAFQAALPVAGGKAPAQGACALLSETGVSPPAPWGGGRSAAHSQCIIFGTSRVPPTNGIWYSELRRDRKHHETADPGSELPDHGLRMRVRSGSGSAVVRGSLDQAVIIRSVVRVQRRTRHGRPGYVEVHGRTPPLSDHPGIPLRGVSVFSQ